ncbi:hypothetical protein CWI39_1001p0010 [Hamiltosporidium magnivora]|uniref:Uncharacterized protein n=1 Tax=Hamiltosporidium magnivora TaxID=148818 RepID=A0A4Q9L6J3_9MICR|nr:hypothetical protein CWI39_1001p0010 [Hamiltosporidium magnivora]
MYQPHISFFFRITNQKVVTSFRSINPSQQVNHIFFVKKLMKNTTPPQFSMPNSKKNNSAVTTHPNSSKKTKEKRNLNIYAFSSH